VFRAFRFPLDIFSTDFPFDQDRSNFFANLAIGFSGGPRLAAGHRGRTLAGNSKHISILSILPENTLSTVAYTLARNVFEASLLIDFKAIEI
jgi:hypothetical protein